jgi:hypothetical protein
MPTDLPFIIAEIAIAFAGYSGLVVELSSRSERSPDRAQLELEQTLGLRRAAQS